MAYLSFSAKGQQLGRRALHTSAIIGRAPDCDISIRDILLSRHHCKVELEGSAWVLTDLSSKNGTFVDGQAVVHPRRLRDGEAFTIGQTVVKFRGAQLGNQGGDSRAPIGSRRPADPWEALESTVSGFDFNAARIDVQRIGRTSARPISQFPTPQPNPRDPQGYTQEDLYSMLTEIASSSWDSIYSHASRNSPLRPHPRPMIQRRQARQGSIVHQDLLREATKQLLKQADRENSRLSRRHRWSKHIYRMLKGFTAVAQWLLLLGSILHQVCA